MSSHEPYSATASVPPLPYFKSCNNVTISTKYAVNSSQLFLQSNSVVTTLCLLDKFCILHGKISSNCVGMELILNKWGQSPVNFTLSFKGGDKGGTILRLCLRIT